MLAGRVRGELRRALVRRGAPRPGATGPRLEIGPVVEARDPEHDADQQEEREHGRRAGPRGKAERGGEGVYGLAPDDAVDMPVLAEPRSNIAHEAHQPGEGDGDED